MRHIPEATAEAEPPELPPATLTSVEFDGPEGFRAGPKDEWRFSELRYEASQLQSNSGEEKAAYPIPNSSMFVFPIKKAPEFRNNLTTVASKGLL